MALNSKTFLETRQAFRNSQKDYKLANIMRIANTPMCDQLRPGNNSRAREIRHKFKKKNTRNLQRLSSIFGND
jgi:hypothetical protein